MGFWRFLGLRGVGVDEKKARFEREMEGLGRKKRGVKNFLENLKKDIFGVFIYGWGWKLKDFGFFLVFVF